MAVGPQALGGVTIMLTAIKSHTPPRVFAVSVRAALITFAPALAAGGLRPARAQQGVTSATLGARGEHAGGPAVRGASGWVTDLDMGQNQTDASGRDGRNSLVTLPGDPLRAP